MQSVTAVCMVDDERARYRVEKLDSLNKVTKCTVWREGLSVCGYLDYYRCKMMLKSEEPTMLDSISIRNYSWEPGRHEYSLF